jgi:hypothetical protein
VPRCRIIGTMSRTFYKLDVEGIVYLVDPDTAAAYTYDLTNPTRIGQVIWTDVKADPRIELLPNWEEILHTKLATAAAAPPPA